MRFQNILFIGFMVTALMSAYTEVKKSEPEIILIPDGFTGKLHIVFTAPNGKPPQYEGGSRVYDIPPSGVLVTQMDTNEGWIERGKVKFFSVSNTGTRKPIIEVSENTPESVRAVYYGSIGQAGPVFGCTIMTQEYIVGTKSQRTDLNKLLTIFEAIKVKNIDKKLFEGMC
ncbi:DUF6843 domain-containing protein [Pseudoalteromonas ruthenica]|uniref:DUF6843 domain-containing protein n=1 Tax=Pseudoalteromonas ruthenica TaxID=151081 RepID=UPI0003B67288|nr:hypothetical protein [Pseudoalteromonas ruthenica]